MPELAEAAKKTKAWACYDCGKCTATCPIARVGGSYSPRRHVLATNLGQQREIVENNTLFTCLTCSLCDRRCPAQVTYTELVRDLRELSHGHGVEPECPHGGALQSVMRMMAKGGTQQNRMGWLSQDLKTESAKGQVFYWTGCTMYYDAFFPEFQVKTLEGTRSAVRLMNKLGINPVVSPDERCCGHDLLWNGDRKSFELLAEHNVKLVANSGAELLVTSCAECLRTWKVDYEPFFGAKPPRIVHVTEYLAEHLPDLKFDTDRAAGTGPDGDGSRGPVRVTYQDPCRLGRHLGIYFAPRQLLEALPGVELSEMRRSEAAAICCAGGTWSNCDRFAKQIQVERLREARATGAQVLVTACPKCQVHFRCAMKDPNLGGEIEIEMRDVVELVDQAVGQK
ncbi:MAG: (Fe-S)-binding protein [Phycisphaerales bacterium]|nr:MAG: (Fe-S)-binding protein [Phycisphaerales bacterium]